MFVDTHSHINFNAYKNDWKQVIARSLANNVWMVNIGSQYATSKRAIEIAEKYPEGVYAAVGLHPIYAKEKFCVADYKNFIKSKKVIAIGEIGLDYKPEYSAFKERQKEVFLEQLDLAKELNLPVIFHCRMAHQDLIEVLDRGATSAECRGRTSIRGVVHCFTGNWEQAKKYLEIGFYLGFNGIIFKFNINEVIKKMPLDKILLETDCPYLTPPATLRKPASNALRSNAGWRSVAMRAGPLQKLGRNEPLYVKYIAQEIAKIKDISFEQVAERTSKNARNFFNI